MLVTTAALQGSDTAKGKPMPKHGVAILDLERNVKSWMGIPTGVLNGTYLSEVDVTSRLFPDANRDTVTRLTKVMHVKCRVVQSHVPALVIGRKVHGYLLDRKGEELEFATGGEVNHEGITLRLEEMLDAARAEGMTEAGLKRARAMITDQFYNIWPLKLRPGDVADIPPLEIKLKEGDEFHLPKPYHRRYTPAEMKWWKATENF